MKKIIPQFELPGAESAFNLMVETTLDGARAEKEKQQAEAERKAAEAQQQEMQL